MTDPIRINRIENKPLKVKAMAPVIRDTTPDYEGPYTVEPSTTSEVVLQTSNKRMRQDVTVERATLEELNVTVTENGETRIEAEEGYLGLSAVNLTTNVQPDLESKSVEYNTNGDFTVRPSEGKDGLSEVNVRVNTPVIPSYSISVTITNGTYSGATKIVAGQTASLTLSANEGYVLPAQADIEVSGATIDSYNQSTGQLVLKWGIFNVTVNTSCASAYPVKGDIINIDMNGDGTDEQYLVLKSVGSDNVVEVLARVNYNSTTFADYVQVYENSNLDTLLNTTYYATLSADATAAIVDKTFRQDSWYWNTNGDPDYHGVYNVNNNHYDISLGNASFGNEITRHVYALSVQDVIEYLEVATSMTYDDTTLNMANVREMFNITSGGVWLRSANADNSSRVMFARGDWGYVDNTTLTPYNNKETRPAFQIDLSKIAWSPVTE